MMRRGKGSPLELASIHYYQVWSFKLIFDFSNKSVQYKGVMSFLYFIFEFLTKTSAELFIEKNMNNILLTILWSLASSTAGIMTLQKLFWNDYVILRF
jgi:hypothetical protein